MTAGVWDRIYKIDRIDTIEFVRLTAFTLEVEGELSEFRSRHSGERRNPAESS